jgi:hypothetical protein
MTHWQTTDRSEGLSFKTDDEKSVSGWDRTLDAGVDSSDYLSRTRVLFSGAPLFLFL